MFWLPKRLRVEIRSRARDEARWLLRDHGDEAESVLAAKLRRPGLSTEFRLRYKQTAVELRKLRPAREESGRELALYSPRQSRLFRLMRRLGEQRKLDQG